MANYRIRHASGWTDTNGKVCYYIDGDRIRHASGWTDTWGKVCYFID